MRFLPTWLHATIDYPASLLLMIVPLMTIPKEGPAVWVPFAIGTLMIVMSLFTDYEMGISDLIPIPTHLMMDALFGVFLATSPWLFGFSDLWVPYMVVGVAEVVAALTTKLRSEPRSQPAV